MYDSERFARLLRSLNAIGAAARDLDALLECIVEETMRFSDASGAVVEMLDGDDLVFVRAGGRMAALVGLRIPLEGSLSGLCVRLREMQYSGDCEHDARVNLVACRQAGVRALIVAPLAFGDRVIGVLKAASESANAFSPEQVRALDLAAGIIAGMIGRQTRIEDSEREGEMLSAELQASIARSEGYRRAALNDPLTGLPNRRGFEAALELAVLHGSDMPGTSALLFVDVNGFKAINDSRGHETGDHALCRIAEVLRASAKEADFVARLAGDEFVVLVRELSEPERELGELCQTIAAAFAQTQMLAGGEHLTLSVAIGVALHDSPELTRAEWLRRADDAMYRSKQCGHFRFFGGSEPQLRIVKS